MSQSRPPSLTDFRTTPFRQHRLETKTLQVTPELDGPIDPASIAVTYWTWDRGQWPQLDGAFRDPAPSLDDGVISWTAGPPTEGAALPAGVYAVSVYAESETTEETAYVAHYLLLSGEASGDEVLQVDQALAQLLIGTVDEGEAAALIRREGGEVFLDLTLPPGPEGPPGSVNVSDADPEALGSPGPGISEDASRADHVHPMPSAGDVGADPAGTASSAVEAHRAAGVHDQPQPPAAHDHTLDDITDSGGAAALDVGTGPSTVAAGDDARLSDAREWTADTVSQAEAEAGEANTRRAWTAQRVAQAIASLVSVAWTQLTGTLTLSQLNSAISDATVDDSGSPRTPTEHGNEAHSEDVETTAGAQGKVDARVPDPDGEPDGGLLETASGVWTAAPPRIGIHQPVYPSGLWALPNAVGIGTQVAVVGRMVYSPLTIWGTTTIDALAIHVTTAVDPSVCRLGLYSSLDGRPHELIREFGTVSTATTGVKEFGLSPDLQLPRGMFFLAAVAQEGASNPTYRGMVSVPRACTSDPIRALDTQFNVAFRGSGGIYGSLPSDTSGANALIGTFLSTLAYAIAVRYA